MRNIENAGLKQSDIDRGYSDTGYIPEEFDNLSKIGDMEKKEAKDERAERVMAEKYGWTVEEKSGGFLERNNTDDRY